MNEGFFIFGLPCFVFLGFFIYFQNTHKHILSTIFKGLASSCFLLYAIYQIIWVKNNTSEIIDIKYSIDIFIALGFGLIGDVLLNLKDIFKKPIKMYLFFGGVFSFLIGHLFFLVHLFKLMSFKEFSFLNPSLVYFPIITGLLFAALLILLVLKVVKKDNATKAVGMTYLTVISILVCTAGYNMIMALTSVSASLSNLRNYFIVMFVACFAFASSDVILIFNSFGPHPRPWISAINLALYYAAQLLMGLSIYFLLVAGY